MHNGLSYDLLCFYGSLTYVIVDNTLGCTCNVCMQWSSVDFFLELHVMMSRISAARGTLVISCLSISICHIICFVLL